MVWQGGTELKGILLKNQKSARFFHLVGFFFLFFFLTEKGEAEKVTEINVPLMRICMKFKTIFLDLKMVEK